MNKNINIKGLLLAAGLSRRMDEFKPLKKYGWDSFLANILRKMDICCSEIIVVTGYNKYPVEQAIVRLALGDKITLVYNPLYEEGMFSSLRAGLAFEESADYMLYHFSDQPHLPADYYRKIPDVIDGEYDWYQPVYDSIKGHPIIFGDKVIRQIQNAPLSSNLKSLSANEKIRKKYFACSHPEIISDFDTPSDIEEYFTEDNNGYL